MPVSVESAISGPFTPNGVTTTFAFTFKAASDSEVIVLDKDGNTLSSALYSVDLDDDEGGSVIFSVAPELADYTRLYIVSDPTMTSTADFDNAGPSFNPAALTRAIDRTVIRDIALMALIDRTPKVPFLEAGPTLPALDDRVGGYVAWDADGNFVAASGTGADSALRTDLADTGGAALVGMSDGVSVESELVKWRTQDLGTVDAGTTTYTDRETTILPAADGTTDFRSDVNTLIVGGSNPAQQIIARQHRLEAYHSASNITFLYGYQGFIRLNLAGETFDGTVTSARGFQHHIAVEGDGSISSGFNFHSQAVDLQDATGASAFTDIAGFYCSDQGHATKISSSAVGFYCGNFTQGAPITASFMSDMVAGTGMWTVYGNSAPSSFKGNVRIGDNVAPTYPLETKGFAKLSEDGTIVAGSFHDISSGEATYSLYVDNTHATTPKGLIVRFTAVDPNDTTQDFLRCEALGTARLRIWSNGNVVNTNNSYGAISDKRLKTGIRNATPQLEDVRALKVRKFRMKADGKDAPEHLGLVAQEVEKVSPGLVFEDDEGIKGVHYSLVNMKLLKAFQELADLVEKQGKEIDRLKAAKKKGA